MDFKDFINQIEQDYGVEYQQGPVVSLPPVNIHYDPKYHQFVPDKGVHQAFAKKIDSNGASEPYSNWQPLHMNISLWK